ncbi:SafA/ExsA family spore coat assembly protein [Effusibacillus consociatus]|uniref:SafA/ExsA family spore coat assembly protein n=1 Tax=Effusibacillus consociatus TaxID=1117041 RepID=A0ABV9Q8U5_9BACL
MKVHVVQKGDTLWKIAKMHGVPLASVIAANPQIADPDKINVGMKVNVPTEGENVASPTPEVTPGLGHAGTLPGAEMPFEPIPMPEGMNMTKYVVQSGDTLWKIAKKTGHSLASIIAANPQIPNPDMIMPGQVINIPTHHHGDMTGMPVGPGLSPKEMMTMPKAKMTEIKPIKAAPVPPVPMPPAPMIPPAPIHHEIDVTMLHYHPQYHVELKPYAKKHHVTKPIPMPAPKPAPVPTTAPVFFPPPVYGPCPPGTYPAIMDEWGNLYPYPVFPHIMPYMMPPYMFPPMPVPAPGMGMAPSGLPSGLGPSGFSPQSAQDWQKMFPSTPKMTRGEEGAEEPSEE